MERYCLPATTIHTISKKRDSFIAIVLLHEGLTHIHSQKKPRLHFGESFTLRKEEFKEQFCTHKKSF